jgi:hypothetical protein
VSPQISNKVADASVHVFRRVRDEHIEYRLTENQQSVCAAACLSLDYPQDGFICIDALQCLVDRVFRYVYSLHRHDSTSVSTPYDIGRLLKCRISATHPTGRDERGKADSD